MNMRAFGQADGVPVLEVTLHSRAGAVAKILSWGGVLRDLVVPGPHGPQRVVLGLESMEDYARHSPHMGATAGRFANRIKAGRFSIDSIAYATPCNEGGKNSLHGGGHGFGKRPWKLGAHDDTSVTLTLHSPAGDAGYPGNLDVTLTYRLLEPATLEIEMRATTDAPTIINLAHHSYFNLDGSSDARDHEVSLNAAFYTPVDDENIPTGEIRAVSGTPFEFRAARPIRNAAGQLYDHNFVVAGMPDEAPGLAHVASLHSPKSGLTMHVHSTEPAVQFYDGAKLNVPVPGLGGAHYSAHAGVCFEPQVYPDSPNHRHFPSAVLRPDGEYRQVTRYVFS